MTVNAAVVEPKLQCWQNSGFAHCQKLFQSAATRSDVFRPRPHVDELAVQPPLLPADDAAAAAAAPAAAAAAAARHPAAFPVHAGAAAAAHGATFCAT